MFENVDESLEMINTAGIFIGKVQISNAIEAKINKQDDIVALNQLFADEKFLHQTKISHNNQLVAELYDLNLTELTQQFEQYKKITARIHYHIPIHQKHFKETFLGASQTAIETTLNFIANKLSYTPKLEIETYTWLNFIENSEQQTNQLHQGLQQEFLWLEQALLTRNLLT